MPCEGELILLIEAELSVVSRRLKLYTNLTVGLLWTEYMTNGDQWVVIESHVLERQIIVSAQASLTDYRLQSSLAGPKFYSRTTNTNCHQSAADQKRAYVISFSRFLALVCGHLVGLCVERWRSCLAYPRRRTRTEKIDTIYALSGIQTHVSRVWAV
jgi:hypothetical protein